MSVRADPPAVLLGGEAIALSVARSLTHAGVEVHAFGHYQDPLRHSRARASFTAFGDSSNVRARWLSALERGPSGAVIIPCSDDGLEMVARNRESLVELGYVPVETSGEAVLAMLDKAETYELARGAGIAAPRTATLASEEDAAEVIDRVPPPWALKPLHAHHFAHHFGLRKKAFIVRDVEELRGALGRTSGLGFAMMLTEIIPGPDHAFESYYSYLDAEGEPLFEFTKRKLRQYPTGFGLGTLHQTDWNPEAAELGLRFFRAAGIRGLANVEFKRDSRDGQLKLIECNYRFTAATQLLRRAGLDLPVFVYDRALARPRREFGRYRTGVSLWYPVEDTRAFLDYRRRGELTFGQWARSLARRQHFPVASWRDPLPAVVRHGRMVARRSRRRHAPDAV